MIAEIVCVGTELLMGQVVNTDAQFIAVRLAELGYQVYYHTTVGDNAKRLTSAVHKAIERSDVVVFTGGLGATDDDLTKETVAAALGLTMEPFPEEVERLKGFFAARGREMPPNNLKQACFPQNAVILPNPKGTAPGCIVTVEGKTAVMLPGPPRELFPMFANHAVPYLEKLNNMRLHSRVLRIFGMGEGDVTYRLRDIIENQTNPTIAPYVTTGEVTLRVTARCASDEDGEKLVAPMVEQIRARIGDVLYSEHGETLPELCLRLLGEQNRTVATAESLTGGLIASGFVDVPGSSKSFLEGCVTYSNEAKMHRLGVSGRTLKHDGAVSEQCAREMAEGMRRTSGADYAISTTGVAGPDGGTEETPVGTAFVALACADGTQVKKLNLFGDRERIRYAAMLNGFDILRRKLCT